MAYNIHPIFVHFPIAFLLVYSFIKIIPLTKWLPKVNWKHIELTTLIVGVLCAFSASATGEFAEKITKANHNLVEMHSLFAGISIWVYSILLLGEILSFAIPYISSRRINNTLVSFLENVKKIINQKIVSIVLAIVGVIAISITGLLGGVMVYGVTADPFAPVVLKILGL